jgi:hypothetical protein
MAPFSYSLQANPGQTVVVYHCLLIFAPLLSTPSLFTHMLCFRLKKRVNKGDLMPQMLLVHALTKSWGGYLPGILSLPPACPILAALGLVTLPSKAI